MNSDLNQSTIIVQFNKYNSQLKTFGFNCTPNDLGFDIDGPNEFYTYFHYIEEVKAFLEGLNANSKIKG